MLFYANVDILILSVAKSKYFNYLCTVNLITKAMKRIKGYKWQQLYENWKNGGNESLFYDWAILEMNNDPGFFRWLFDDGEISDFGNNLSPLEMDRAYEWLLDGYDYLTKENIEDFIGDKVEFYAPAADGNVHYGGVVVIKGVDFSSKKPVSAEIVDGDDINEAILDGEDFCLSDLGRVIRVIRVE